MVPRKDNYLQKYNDSTSKETTKETTKETSKETSKEIGERMGLLFSRLHILTIFSTRIRISLRIENEGFAGDAFMRHPIFLPSQFNCDLYILR